MAINILSANLKEDFYVANESCRHRSLKKKKKFRNVYLYHKIVAIIHTNIKSRVFSFICYYLDGHITLYAADLLVNGEAITIRYHQAECKGHHLQPVELQV